jgi:ABC-type uncharacterized transport system substrate-binding protein
MLCRASGFTMRRRDFLTVLSGVMTAWPFVAHAQQGEYVRRLGVLMSGAMEADPEGQARVGALRQGLKELGWVEGRNLVIDFRWGGTDVGRMRIYATELVVLNPDVVFAAPSAALAQMQRITRTIPIVFAQVSDPVRSGFVASLAHPGGNITGFALYEFALGAKWLELLKQIAPSVTRIAVIYDPVTPSAAGFLPLIEAAGRSLGVDVFVYTVHEPSEIERIIDAFAAEPNGGLIAIPSNVVGAQRDFIVSLANRNRLPSISAFRSYAAAGGLASYGVDNIELYRLAASYIDRILKGGKPSDLPIQEASKFALIINAKTAKALGLTVPLHLQQIADEIIE